MESVEEAVRYARSHFAEFVSDLKELARIPSVSFPGFDPKHVAASAEAAAALLKKSGLENVEILTLPGAHPYVYGDWLRAPGAPTLLLYAHHDVQPPGREELWKSPPFEPAERNGRLYGRGTADDKAGVVAHTSAVAACLKTLGRLPVNVKLIIEGEEEIGSLHLEEFLRRYRAKLSADAMILTDTGNFDVGVPSVTTALRGLASMDVTVRTADHPLHSGMWGGPLPDPVQALAKMIASVTDAKGELAVPGISPKTRRLSAAEKKSLKSLRYPEAKFREQSGLLRRTRILGKSGEILERVWHRPSFSVNAVQASTRKDCANIVNEAAWCHMGVRLAGDMDPQDVLKRLKAHLKKHAPWGAAVEFSNETASPAWTTDPAGPAFTAAAKALEKGYGHPAVFIGCGGSIPFVGPFAQALGGVPALLIGVEDPYTNPHSENESLHLGDFSNAIASAIYLYEALASTAGRRS
ncbi:MAG TPA: M20/M25/M40 family metallo-hydrolase [Elusimicrobiota bacterium]|nr:M20/M25/M40 family metallo-hydrolase [Elusimicrobiota bacterium]